MAAHLSILAAVHPVTDKYIRYAAKRSSGGGRTGTDRPSSAPSSSRWHGFSHGMLRSLARFLSHGRLLFSPRKTATPLALRRHDAWQTLSSIFLMNLAWLGWPARLGPHARHWPTANGCAGRPRPAWRLTLHPVLATALRCEPDHIFRLLSGNRVGRCCNSISRASIAPAYQGQSADIVHIVHVYMYVHVHM